MQKKEIGSEAKEPYQNGILRDACSIIYAKQKPSKLLFK